MDTKTKTCQAQEKEMEKLKINVEETAKNYTKLEGEYKQAMKSNELQIHATTWM